ncbi:hypothetical protein [Rhodoferax aquaticus]|nr:hypothetical protein [Rhodoferax aquaticus]
MGWSTLMAMDHVFSRLLGTDFPIVGELLVYDGLMVPKQPKAKSLSNT